MKGVEFAPAVSFPRGTIAILLRKSYGDLEHSKDLDWEKFSAVFDAFDEEVHSDEWVAACAFVTTYNSIPVGIGSFDPRQRPAYGDIGQNCILPEFKGKGFGTAQMQEILRRMKERGIEKARVSTGAGPFFTPARKMYERCGFVQTRVFLQDAYPYGEMVEFEMPLNA